jgi:hypothetical protein
MLYNLQPLTLLHQKSEPIIKTCLNPYQMMKRTREKPLNVTPGAFKEQAIELIGIAISQRRAIIAKGQSWPLQLCHREVITLYNAHREAWTVRGVARFYLKHGKAILDMIPYTNGPGVIQCKQLIQTAKNLLNGC